MCVRTCLCTFERDSPGLYFKYTFKMYLPLKNNLGGGGGGGDEVRSRVPILLSHLKRTIEDDYLFQTAIGPDDVHLSYLPLAHMFERGMHVSLFASTPEGRGTYPSEIMEVEQGSHV